MSSFLGGTLTTSFSVNPQRTLADLLVDPILHIATFCLLPATFRAVAATSKPVSFARAALWCLVANRLVTLVDTASTLFINNSASATLIYLSLTRSLIRYATYMVALGWISHVRLHAASGLALRRTTTIVSRVLSVVIAALVLAGVGVVVSYYIAGVAFKSAGDTYISQRPRATVAEVQRAALRQTPTFPSYMWQLTWAISVPLVHGVHGILDMFYYSVAAGLWSTTFLNVSKLTPKRWLSLSWPLVTSLVLHINYVAITALSRSIMRRESLGFVFELGMAATTFDWFVWYTRTSSMIEGVEVAEVSVVVTEVRRRRATGREESQPGTDIQMATTRHERRITLYTKHYAPPVSASTVTSATRTGTGSQVDGRQPRHPGRAHHKQQRYFQDGNVSPSDSGVSMSYSLAQQTVATSALGTRRGRSPYRPQADTRLAPAGAQSQVSIHAPSSASHLMAPSPTRNTSRSPVRNVQDAAPPRSESMLWEDPAQPGSTHPTASDAERAARPVRNLNSIPTRPHYYPEAQQTEHSQYYHQQQPSYNQHRANDHNSRSARDPDAIVQTAIQETLQMQRLDEERVIEARRRRREREEREIEAWIRAQQEEEDRKAAERHDNDAQRQDAAPGGWSAGYL